MIKPVELESAEGRDTWDTLVAASGGDVATLRGLLERNPRLSVATYWYLPAVHFAAREGHADAVRLLLDAGADPEENGLHDRSLIDMARERGHEQIAQLLEAARDRRGRAVAQPANHAIHRAAAHGQVDVVRSLLDADAMLANVGGRRGITPLHCAVLGGSHDAVNLLLERGANIHGGNSEDRQAIDFAVWGERKRPINPEMAGLLISRGATYDVTIASALGDLSGVRQMLDESPSRISETRPSGRRPLSAAVEYGHVDIARLLLERGADPRWHEPNAPHGVSLHRAVQTGNRVLVEMLLAHGADPDEDEDSSASPLGWAADTPDIRALLVAHGAGLGAYDTSWIERDDQSLRRAATELTDPYLIGAAFTMSAHQPDLLARLLGAGFRMPAIHTSCQGYLINADALRTLIAHGMSPDQMNWQHQTLLHLSATKETTECAGILVDAGATMTARDDEYRSTPLAWAARANRPQMVEFLLSRGAPVSVSGDEPWATPLAWAERRGHQQVVSILRAHGATR
jgi:ankyrin repeat protein